METKLWWRSADKKRVRAEIKRLFDLNYIGHNQSGMTIKRGTLHACYRWIKVNKLVEIYKDTEFNRKKTEKQYAAWHVENDLYVP